MPIRLEEWSTVRKRLLITSLILIGALLRLAPQAIESIDLPFRSGGLFMEFAHQIRIHHYRLPKTIPFYTVDGIPFAYPPLPFYIAAFALAVFPLPSFMIANLLPPFVATISIAAFYQLTCSIKLRLKTRMTAVLAYATIPYAFLQQVESAGLAEAFGVLGLILFAYTLAKAHHTDRIVYYAFAGGTWTLCVVSSPGTAYSSTLIFLAFAILKIAPTIRSPRIQSLLTRLVITGLIAVTLSSPYWLTVAQHHGFQIFFGSLGAQQKSFWDTFLKFLIFRLSGGAIQFWWNMLIFVGLLSSIVQKRWGLLIWFVILYSIPREGQWMATVPASLLAGIGIVDMSERFVTKERVGKVAYLFLWTSFLIYSIGNPIREISYYAKVFNRAEWEEAVSAMAWARKHLPAESHLVVLSKGEIREWAPHLVRRTVLNVDQGTEWVPTESEQVGALNSSLNRCTDLTCIANAVKPFADPQTTYLLLNRNDYGHLYLTSSTGAQPTWENKSVVIGPILPTH